VLITIPGNPVPLARARVSTRGGFPRMYDPPKNKEAKEAIAIMARREMGSLPPMKGPLLIHTRFYLQKPKGKIRVNSTPYPQPDCKPDLDNLVKLVLDALNGITYEDDAQCVQISATKYWANTNMEPCTIINLMKLP